MAFFDKLNRSLKKKLILIFLLITILPIIFLGLLNYNREKNLMKEQVFLFNKSLANSLGIKINHYAQEKLDQISYLASNDNLEQSDLLAFKKLYSGFEVLYVIGQNGHLKSVSEGFIKAKENYYSETWFQNAISGQSYISNYHKSEFINQPSIQFAVPIRANNKIIGVLGAEINLDIIKELITSSIDDIEYSDIYLIDSTGKPLYSKEGVTNIDSSQVQSFVKYILFKGKNGIKEYKNENGVDILGSYKFIKSLGWAIIVQQSSEEAFAEIRESLWNNLILVLVVGGVVTLISLKLTNSIFSPIDQLQINMKRISKGDYTQKINIERQDEIGELITSFNKLIAQQVDIVSDLKDSSMEISNTSKELFLSSKKSHKANQAVTDYIEDTVNSIQEITATNQEISTFSEETTASAQSGKEQVEEAITQITKINNFIIQANQASKELAEESKKIKEINNLIINITDQINLLSLNASIEAARASSTTKGSGTRRGRAGQGFSVVAEEIGSLAKETAKATAKINQTIKEVEAGIKNVLSMVSKGTQEADKGAKIIKVVAQSFDEIAAAIEETSLQLESVNMSTQQVSAKSEEVRDSAKDMNLLSKDVSNVSLQLEEMSSSLERITNKFEV
ncbi:methyl-accepting chemotaxis protein [Orenia metallireducens]|uniref:Methyl-accepting chemotaxis protein n=1 Tax=Orenia metallireducens TaxID=1413210 RepID=A0A285IK54_9FIRM|nr:methyl-accepting chemotaxis protein [Orenia metallireducens]PRX17476.1 methyl-accepting chemotaxis protein [Orenia metallireducens]SNY47476.1 methyl-accepting chemotaxis protein [Orenia metallireducens]